jgi:hypothetical protein
MTDRRGNRWRKRDFAEYLDPHGGMAIKLGTASAGNGQIIHLAANYVIFEREYPLTFVVDDPPLVATLVRPQVHESWFTDTFTCRLRELAFGSQDCYSRKALRVSDGPNPHRHLRFRVDGEDWRSRLAALLQESGRAPVDARSAAKVHYAANPAARSALPQPW